MKIKNCLVASAALVVASCSSTDNTVVTARPAVVTKPQTQVSGQYLALPGQAAVAVSSDVNSAFEAQVAQYNGQTAAANYMGNAMSTATANTVASALAPLQQPVTPSPMLPVASTGYSTPTYIHQSAVPGQAAVGMEPGMGMTPTVPTMGVPMNYSVRITNSTNGKIFVEAQDAAGTIYPCGFMDGGRSATTPMEQADPIVGPITIVVRDPR